MTIWPEVRASFRLYTGRELARASIDEFVEHVLWYMINSSESAPQRREALVKALRGEMVESDDGLTINKAVSQMDQLDEFERWRTSRV